MQCTHGIEDTIYTLIKISSLSCCLRDSYASRMLHLRPLIISRCLQRVDPFTVAPEMPAPESVTPSADLRRFPANFISKIALKNNISCINVFFKIFLDFL